MSRNKLIFMRVNIVRLVIVGYISRINLINIKTFNSVKKYKVITIYLARKKYKKTCSDNSS